jgi:prepilin signal peptidase PulO-like enzyme (type II secretory pathway)
LSILCTIHCLAMPVILTALPFLGNTLINETTEHILILASLIIAIFLLSKDYQVHQNRLPFILLFVSVVFNFVGVFLVNKSNETIFVVLGACSMSAAYLYNWWLHKKVCHSHSH